MTVYKLIEIVGTSPTGVDDAIKGAIERAGETLDDLGWFEVKEIRGRVVDEWNIEYQVKIHLGFRLHAAEEGPKATKAPATKEKPVAARGGQTRTPLAKRQKETRKARTR